MHSGRRLHVPALVIATGQAQNRQVVFTILFQSIQFNYGWYELAQLSGYGDGSFSMLFKSFTDPFQSGVMEMFLRARGTPQQNSQ
jgi:hypothetical protein